MNYVICHYAEIGLKGKNRRFFEEKLVENIKTALPAGSFRPVKRISGRILITLQEVQGVKLLAERKKAAGALKNVFGIAYFCFSQNCKQDIKAIRKKAVEMLSGRNFKTFRIQAKRSDKKFPLTSGQINEQVGAYILAESRRRRKEPRKPARGKKGKTGQEGVSLLPRSVRVDLERPDITLFIEIVEKFVFLYIKKIKGPGGLPVGVSGRAVALLSGGIDSPVAAFLALKRGVNVVFLHFHAYPYTGKASIEKVRRIVRVLSKFQPASKLYLAPFGDIQKQILLKTPAALRVVLYRRMMMRVARLVAAKEKAGAIVSGESLGQVASQTMENMAVIEQAADRIVFRPLLGQDKEEIIKMARKIGTFGISILPEQDCCVRFLPKHPATKTNLAEVEKAEKELNIKELAKVCYNNIEPRLI